MLTIAVGSRHAATTLTHCTTRLQDKIACMVKTLIEQRIGPTWHVLVGKI